MKLCDIYNFIQVSYFLECVKSHRLTDILHIILGTGRLWLLLTPHPFNFINELFGKT